MSFVGWATTASDTCAEPPGVQQDDVLIALVDVVSVGSGATGPAGWTKIGTDRTAHTHATNCWYIVRGASAPALKWGIGGGLGFSEIAIVAYRGVVTGGPVEVFAEDTNTLVSPSIITITDQDVVVSIFSCSASMDPTPPVGMTRRIPAISSAFINAADAIKTPPGATGTMTWTDAPTPNWAIGIWSLALKPIVAPPPPPPAAVSVIIHNEKFGPLIGVEVEAFNLETGAIEAVAKTDSTGTATFPALTSPYFFRPRITRSSGAPRTYGEVEVHLTPA